jgi:hypothetical protein
MKKSFLLVLGCLLIIVLLPIKTFAQKDGDWQFWNTVSLEKQINKELKIILEEETRLGQDMGDFAYQHIDAGLMRKMTNWLDLSLNYRHIFQKKDNAWEEEYRPHFNATLKCRWFNLDFSNRNRFEYRILSKTKDSWRYRNMSKIKIPLNWTKFKLSPYIAEEAFFNFDQGDFNRNRLYLGSEFKLVKNLQGELYYLRQSSESRGNWTDINVLGTKIKLIF